MEFDEENLKNLIDELALVDRVSLADMPDIDLYMEQLLTFLDHKLGVFKREAGDKILTKTMINNYAKVGLIPKPKNKKYTTYHIILLILIYNLKNVLSINDIQSLFNPILKNINDPSDDVIPLEEIYATFLELKDSEYEDFAGTFNEKFKLIKDRTAMLTGNISHDIAELFLTVIMLIAQANASKRMAEKIIDNFFKY